MPSFQPALPLRVHVIVHRKILLIAALSLCSPLATAQDDLAFEPYPVFVAEQEAFARCGPSSDYYRTDPLRHGQELEVYAETEDGWLGIRPPEESFCWIPAETVELDESKETGIVIEDRTVAWIGTQLGRARTYRWQVQLAKGEPVTIVGRSEREGPDGPQLWLRIVPPSGEYRWVHRNQVVDSSEELVAMIRRQSSQADGHGDVIGEDSLTEEDRPSTSGSAASLSTSQSSRRTTRERELVASSGRSVLQQERQPVGSGLNETWQSSEDRVAQSHANTSQNGPVAANTGDNVTDAMKRRGLLASVEFLGRPRLLEIGSAPAAPRGSETASDSNWIAGDSAAGSRMQSASANSIDPSLSGFQPMDSPIRQVSGQQPIAPATLAPAAAPVSNITPPVVSAARIAQIEAETVGADVDRLSLIFSRLIAARATAVEIEPVQRAAQALGVSSLDAVAAGRARLLAERAEQYRGVANRRDGMATVHNVGSVVPAAGVGGLGTVVPIAEQVPQADTKTGFLVQVYSARTNSPPFALTDNAGRTIAYVTPTPGVHLRPHLNSRITVEGSPGYLTGLNTPHIMATQALRTPE